MGHFCSTVWMLQGNLQNTSDTVTATLELVTGHMKYLNTRRTKFVQGC